MEIHDRNLCASCLQEEYDAFSHECIHETMAKNEKWLRHYKINSWPRWDYSMDEATLTFSEAGAPKVFCEMQVVGSTEGDSWEWSWGNKNYPDICKTRMLEVKELGAIKQWDQLTSLFLTNDEYLGWKCASIATHVLNGIFTYRCPHEGDFLYLAVLSAQFVN